MGDPMERFSQCFIEIELEMQSHRLGVPLRELRPSRIHGPFPRQPQTSPDMDGSQQVTGKNSRFVG